ncbi:MAG: endonuclease III domain-containing protein [Proteobacteria bacterium]|nr:endonuclease III domain-containing protein [Pseudomonadota bacterium]MBU1738263.1 endonuclease III domain-containing protein [Pseudomonadota bacterium]
MSERINEIYRRLLDHFGPQGWWPGETPFEVMVGAVLTQNTNWGNVEKAITNLKNAGFLSLEALADLDRNVLAELIRPSGYYNLKAKRLKNLLAAITENEGDLDDYFACDLETLREKLLQVKGIGPETADSIILYAAEKPSFVVDAYTVRILRRHDLVWEEADYHEIRELFMDSLPEDTALYNEYHALIVKTAKEFCLKNNPRCEECPLKGI